MLSRDEVVEKVRDAIIETFDLKEPLDNDNITFKDDLKADSLDMVSLALVLEDEFSAEIEIEEEQVDSFINIHNVVDYIMTKQEQAMT